MNNLVHVISHSCKYHLQGDFLQVEPPGQRVFVLVCDRQCQFTLVFFSLCKFLLN